MEWLTENWFWIVVGVLFVVMHLFGHGGHGGNSKQDDQDNHSEHRH